VDSLVFTGRRCAIWSECGEPDRAQDRLSVSVTTTAVDPLLHLLSDADKVAILGRI
jgi:hypothetical protein